MVVLSLVVAAEACADTRATSASRATPETAAALLSAILLAFLTAALGGDHAQWSLLGDHQL